MFSFHWLFQVFFWEGVLITFMDWWTHLVAVPKDPNDLNEWEMIKQSKLQTAFSKIPDIQL